MEVIDFGGTHSAHSVEQLQQLLGARFKHEMNEFKLCAEERPYPVLVIYASGRDIAALYYVPKRREPGYMSVGGQLNLDPEKATPFSVDNLSPESIEIRNGFIVPFSKAVEVAKEFFHSQELPRSIEWYAL